MQIGETRLLSIADVVERTGFCRTVASALIDETGKSIVLHRRKYILESDLLAHLQGLAGAHGWSQAAEEVPDEDRV